LYKVCPLLPLSFPLLLPFPSPPPFPLSSPFLFLSPPSPSFPLQNTGEVSLSYEWVPLDSPLTLHPSHLHLDDSGSIVSEGGEVMPFTITPCSGQLPPGEEQSFFLRFSPLDVTTTECTFRCKCVHLCNAETTLSWSV